MGPQARQIVGSSFLLNETIFLDSQIEKENDCSGSPIDTVNLNRNFRGLQYSLFIFLFIEVIGAFFFIALSWYVAKDKAKIDVVIAGEIKY